MRRRQQRSSTRVRGGGAGAGEAAGQIPLLCSVWAPGCFLICEMGKQGCWKEHRIPSKGSEPGPAQSSCYYLSAVVFVLLFCSLVVCVCL